MKKLVMAAAAIAALTAGAAPAFAQAPTNQFTYQFSAVRPTGCTFNPSTSGPDADMAIAVNATQTIQSPGLTCTVAIANLPVRIQARSGKLVHQSNQASVFADYSVTLRYNGANQVTDKRASEIVTPFTVPGAGLTLAANTPLTFDMTAKITSITAATLGGSYFDTVALTIG